VVLEVALCGGLFHFDACKAASVGSQPPPRWSASANHRCPVALPKRRQNRSLQVNELLAGSRDGLIGCQGFGNLPRRHRSASSPQPVHCAPKQRPALEPWVALVTALRGDAGRESKSSTRCSDLCLPSTVHTNRFTGFALNEVGEMSAPGTACARPQIQRKPLQPAVDFDSKVGSGNRLWRRS
jgi:hypothetical protein